MCQTSLQDDSPPEDQWVAIKAKQADLPSFCLGNTSGFRIRSKEGGMEGRKERQEIDNKPIVTSPQGWQERARMPHRRLRSFSVET